MIPTVEEVRRMSIDARKTQRPPAPGAASARQVPARAVSASGKPSAAGVWVVPVAVIVLIVALTLAGVLVARGMRRVHPASAPASALIVSTTATVGGEGL